MNRQSRLNEWLPGWLRRRFASSHSAWRARRGPVDHVIMLDGTMSSLAPGEESNVGRSYLLLKEAGSANVYYEAGVQWTGWGAAPDVAMGRGINRQIQRAYGWLASRYRPGDRIFLLGYSRGGYAVRSLAGIIDRVGLLRADSATERNIRQAYRLYRFRGVSQTVGAFQAAHCHAGVAIEMLGVWDTVKALGMRLPLLWRFSDAEHAFHSHELGPRVKAGFQALARDETRQAYAPVLWSCPPGFAGHVEQVWFKGTHGDVGGQLGGQEDARPLANIPLVWMLDRLEERGIALPEGWRDRFPQDVNAPSIGLWQGVSKLFVLRAPRVIGADPSERMHETIAEAEREPA
ncbi:DUF2235 domain-containing protein [Tropicibacter alexandrii]|uniref:DUF2235 domain-containing protein n=1 Tax=Tropicibacter alexandrii TaxID=2267683 RepID=UPI000EF55A11|nr:DUF2235 domain-containing protein [Tropicibacter alexandrii]